MFYSFDCDTYLKASSRARKIRSTLLGVALIPSNPIRKILPSVGPKPLLISTLYL